MKLIIAEKPSVGKAIASAIGATQNGSGCIKGNGYIVSWCFGHLMQLFMPDDYGEQWSGDWNFSQLPMIPEKWRFKILKGCGDQYKILKNLMSSSEVSEIICATDADREGECIFRYVFYSTGSKKSVKRLWVSSLEEKSIKDGLANITDLSHYNSLFNAGFSRAKADWLIGMNGTRLFSVRYGTKLTLGRVQTPTLAMIVKRYFDVKNFVKAKYFTVDIDCGAFKAKSDRLDDEDMAQQRLTLVYGKNATVKSMDREEKKANPPKLFDLTTLQREANRYFGYTAAQTSEYMQKLYEAALVTYPRTDSQYITDDMENTAINCVHAVYKTFSCFGSEPETFSVKRCINNKKVEGHHAILPTVKIAETDIDTLPFGQQNILRLISARLIMAVGEVSVYEAVKIVVDCENNDFTATGKKVITAGWKDTETAVNAILRTSKTDKDDEEAENDSILPDVVIGQTFSSISAEVSEHWTAPPKLYTESALLSAMERAGNEEYDDETEKKGLGTPATRAAIIEGLVKNQYIERKGKKIIPTDKGIELINVVPEEIKSPKLTADWEMQLQQIEKGRYSADSFLHGIKAYVADLCDKYAVRSENSAFTAVSTSSLGNCPKCGKDVKYGKSGAYCTGRCGMVIGYVYGHKLTEKQVSALLSGQLISYTVKGAKTIVQPSFRQNDYNGKTTYQWVAGYK
ncbi:MAG: DNA topoisomerase 3 [Ruminococcus sp.]|nr:DNA topoisomerase 3 [Ruminococcus sp.]